MPYFLRFPQSVTAALLLLLSFFTVNLSKAQSAATASQSPGAAHIEYHFPMDGSDYVPTRSSIILRPNVAVGPAAMLSVLKVTGATSGLHTGSIVQSDDKRTLVFIPREPFSLGERVAVTIQKSSESSEDVSILPAAFSFNVSPSEPSLAD